LEGLINILDSEGGFGSLEMQVDIICYFIFMILTIYWLSPTFKLAAFPGASSSSLG
jgi:hypothetical protein